MRIGELARSVGLRTSAIRYYESLGVLEPARRVSGRREYDGGAVNRLRLLQAAQHAGFTLAETRVLLPILANDGRSGKRWREIAQRKLQELDASIEQLKSARKVLADAIDCACAGSADSCTLVARSPARVSSWTKGGVAPRS